MSELKCRYCGGNIADLGDGTGKCESCGSRLALPKKNEKVNDELYNRADHLRKIHDYDGAISAYEQLVAGNPMDSEARWSLLLCKYGVEYIYDKRTESYVPTINRMSLDSILEDRDYLKALEYADEAAKEEYRRQALKLAAIQDELEKIVRENENYEVFISFKATDEKRKRTRDYALAQEIYDALSADGLRVFFSPVSLRPHVGEVYEPFIFAALYSAKVMILVGTKREHLESEWVKNEWSRYLFMTRENPEKHILPVCEGMKPEEFPAGIGKMQAISMNTVGALGLIRERVTGYTMGQERRVYVKTASGQEMDLTNRLRRLQFAAEDGDFSEAADWIKMLRDELGEKHPEVEYPALLVKYQAKNDAELSAHLEELEEDEDYHWLLQNGSEEQRQRLSRLGEQRELMRQRAFEQKFISQLLELYKSGHYGEIVETVERERKVVAFERDDEIDDFYQRAKRKKEDENLLLRYRETVGDGTTYFEKQLKNKHPQRAKLICSMEDAREYETGLSVLDKIAGLGWIFGLGLIVVWYFLKDTLTTFVLLFDIVLYLIYLAKYLLDKKDPYKDTLSPRILLKSIPVLVVTLVVINFKWGIGPFSEFWGRLFSDGTSDNGLVVYIYLILLFFMILWGGRIWFANRAVKRLTVSLNKEQHEALDFLKHFEAQEELLLFDEFNGINEKDRIPLESLYNKIVNR